MLQKIQGRLNINKVLYLLRDNNEESFCDKLMDLKKSINLLENINIVTLVPLFFCGIYSVQNVCVS